MCERRCTECEHFRIVPAERKTGQLQYRSSGRNRCKCAHRDAEFLSRAMTTRELEPALVAFMAKDNQPKIKTTPRWCPLETMRRPVQLSKNESFRAIGERHPEGLFYVVEGPVISGIISKAGEIEVEEFSTESMCKKWLLDPERYAQEALKD